MRERPIGLTKVTTAEGDSPSVVTFGKPMKSKCLCLRQSVSTLIVTDYLYYSSYIELVLVTKKKNSIKLQSIYNAIV